MKVAILTQPLGKNYGGMMQAFALQKVLRDMGHDVITVDRQANKLGVFHIALRTIVRVIKKALGKRKAHINIENYFPIIFGSGYEFIKKNIRTTETLVSSAELKKYFLDNNYDAIIVGSDQTWRPSYSPNIYDYFLDFLDDQKIKRIAYATSFGVDNWEYTKEETLKCAELASLFDTITVREKSGIDLCKNFLKVDSQNVLDPTLLLSREDYLNLIGDKYNGGDSDGVFTYILDTDDKKNQFSDEVALQLGTKRYSCQPAVSMGSLASMNLDDYTMPFVEDWLASFANARFVVTDSFHGMVFSIIFNKPFYVFVNKGRGASRFISLASQLGFEDRLIEGVGYKIPRLDIDNGPGINKIQSLKEQSLNILAMSLK